MKVLITGGAGFIGSNFVKFFLNKYKQSHVINLDKLTYAGNIKNIKDIKNNKRHKFIKGDICDKKLVDRLAKNTDIIFNFAAETHVDRSIKSANSFLKTNISGVHVLLEATKKYNIKKFIQISTDEVYGSLKNGYANENSMLNPGNPYSASKSAAEHLVFSYYNTYKLPVVITRSSNNFGPYQYPEKLIPLFIKNAINDKHLPVYGDGLYIRDWIYVLDNCRAIDLVFKKGRIGEIYNIGAGNMKANLEIIHLILDLLNKPYSLMEFVKDRLGHDRRYAMNTKKIEKLGFKPIFDFKTAMKITIKWYISNTNWLTAINK